MTCLQKNNKQLPLSDPKAPGIGRSHAMQVPRGLCNPCDMRQGLR